MRGAIRALGGGLAASVALAPSTPPAAGHGHQVDPALFQRGACVTYAAATHPRRATVFIDAGHGGPDPGAVGVTPGGRSVHEADETVRVALDAVAPLRAAGFRVVLSRTGEGAVAIPRPGDLAGGGFTGQGVHDDLLARIACADRARATILIGVYFNASTSASAGGSLTLYDSTRPFAAASIRLAGIVQAGVLGSLRAAGYAVADDGVHDDVGYGSAVTGADRAYGHLVILGPAKPGYLAHPSAMPGALIEPLFVTDPAEASIA